VLLSSVTSSGFIIPFSTIICLVITHCVPKVAVHVGYGIVQLKCDGTRWRTGGEVRKVAVHLIKGVGSDIHERLNKPELPSRASPCAITFQLDSTVA